jgi:hypothetical protein
MGRRLGGCGDEPSLGHVPSAHSFAVRAPGAGLPRTRAETVSTSPMVQHVGQRRSAMSATGSAARDIHPCAPVGAGWRRRSRSGPRLRFTRAGAEHVAFAFGKGGGAGPGGKLGNASAPAGTEGVSREMRDLACPVVRRAGSASARPLYNRRFRSTDPGRAIAMR